MSRRYSLSLTLLLAVSAVPVLVHSYGRKTVDDCRRPADLLLGCGTDADHSLREAWIRDTFGSFAVCRTWIAVDGGEGRLEATILRSFDPKKLYHNPETGLIRDAAVDRREVQWVETGSGTLPVHRSYYVGREAGIFVAYVLAYDGRPVGNPYVAHLLGFPAQLIGGTRPMTMYFVTGTARDGNPSRLEAAGIDWLLRSWRKYSQVCTDSTG